MKGHDSESAARLAKLTIAIMEELILGVQANISCNGEYGEQTTKKTEKNIGNKTESVII